MIKAIQRMKTKKTADERGLVAELLKHVPEDVLTKLLALMNDLLFSGELTPTWQKTVFQMLPHGCAGDITLLVVLETLGTLCSKTFAGISIWATGGPWQGMRTGGQVLCRSSYLFAPNHEQDH